MLCIARIFISPCCLPGFVDTADGGDAGGGDDDDDETTGMLTVDSE